MIDILGTLFALYFVVGVVGQAVRKESVSHMLNFFLLCAAGVAFLLVLAMLPEFLFR